MEGVSIESRSAKTSLRTHLQKLRPRQREHRQANELGKRDPRQHRRSHIHQRHPHPLITLALARRVVDRQRPNALCGTHERARDMRTELDGDAECDDEVDDADGVEHDTPDTHDAHDACHSECDDASHDRTGPP